MWFGNLVGLVMFGVLCVDGAKAPPAQPPPPPPASPVAVPEAAPAEDISAHPNMALVNKGICGVSPMRESGPMFQMPWMALLVYNTSRGVVFSCGGTVISERYVLTAANCVKSLPKYTKLVAVRLGEFDYTEAVDCSEVDGTTLCADPPVDVIIEKIIPHKSYSQKTFRNNIALIKLSSSANFSSDSVKPICLPSTPEESKRWFHEGELLSVVGWGTTSTGMQSPVVRAVHVEYVPADDCAASYRNYTKRVQIFEDQFCLRGTTKGDATSGDGGGPLVAGGFEMLDKVIQYGIVSFGPSSGVLAPPGVYTRVGSFMKWILDNMEGTSDD